MFSLGFFDSLNPATILAMILIVSTENHQRNSLVFIFGTFSIYFSAGVALLFGWENLLNRIFPIMSNFWFGTGLVCIGTVLFGYGLKMLNQKSKVENRQTNKLSSGFLGVTLFTVSSTFMDLPTAFPYFAATDIIAKMKSTFTLKIFNLIFYNVVYVAPLVCIWHLSNKLNNQRYFDSIKKKVLFFNQKILPIIVVLLGIASIGYGISKQFNYITNLK